MIGNPCDPILDGLCLVDFQGNHASVFLLVTFGSSGSDCEKERVVRTEPVYGLWLSVRTL